MACCIQSEDAGVTVTKRWNIEMMQRGVLAILLPLAGRSLQRDCVPGRAGPGLPSGPVPCLNIRRI